MIFKGLGDPQQAVPGGTISTKKAKDPDRDTARQVLKNPQMTILMLRTVNMLIPLGICLEKVRDFVYNSKC